MITNVNCICILAQQRRGPYTGGSFGRGGYTTRHCQNCQGDLPAVPVPAPAVPTTAAPTAAAPVPAPAPTPVVRPAIRPAPAARLIDEIVEIPDDPYIVPAPSPIVQVMQKLCQMTVLINGLTDQVLELSNTVRNVELNVNDLIPYMSEAKRMYADQRTADIKVADKKEEMSKKQLKAFGKHVQDVIIENVDVLLNRIAPINANVAIEVRHEMREGIVKITQELIPLIRGNRPSKQLDQLIPELEEQFDHTRKKINGLKKEVRKYTEALTADDDQGEATPGPSGVPAGQARQMPSIVAAAAPPPPIHDEVTNTTDRLEGVVDDYRGDMESPTAHDSDSSTECYARNTRSKKINKRKKGKTAVGWHTKESVLASKRTNSPVYKTESADEAQDEDEIDPAILDDNSQ